MKICRYNTIGKRTTNEDEDVIMYNINGENKNYNNINFFAVFDGHGGGLISEFLKKNLPSFFLNKFPKDIFHHDNYISQYIYSVYEHLQNKLTIKHPRGSIYCGSTACVIINFKHKSKEYLWCINLGDSRAIICSSNNKATALSKDHKPSEISEKNRIKDLNGVVKYDGYEWRIKNLSVSRSFGDLDHKPYVSHLPTIDKYTINNDKFLVVGCDGLFDVLSNQDIVDFVLELQKNNFTGNIAKELVNYALKKGSMDNITCIFYSFI